MLTHTHIISIVKDVDVLDVCKHAVDDGDTKTGSRLHAFANRQGGTCNAHVCMSLAKYKEKLSKQRFLFLLIPSCPMHLPIIHQVKYMRGIPASGVSNTHRRGLHLSRVAYV